MSMTSFKKGKVFTQKELRNMIKFLLSESNGVKIDVNGEMVVLESVDIEKEEVKKEVKK